MPAPPTVEPDASPTVCVEINQEWASWLQGRVWNMEHLDWSDPWDDHAIDRSSRLADLIAAGNCSGGGVLETVRKVIVPSANVVLNSTTQVSIDPAHQLNINPTANARYRISWQGNIRNQSATVAKLNMYVLVGGVMHFPANPVFSQIMGINREFFHWDITTDPLPAGATIVDYQYKMQAGVCFLEFLPVSVQFVYTLTAEQVE